MKKETVKELKNRLAELLRKKALKKGKFTLSSGKTTNYYLDARVITMNPEGAYLIASLILDWLKNKDIQAVGGPTLGADPIVGAVALLSHVRNMPVKTFIVRKQAKEHGRKRQIEGPPLRKNERVLLVDDVVTTGGSLIEAKKVLDKIGVVVVKSMVIVDRNEGAKEALKQSGCSLEAIFNIKDLGVSPL